MKIIYYFTKHVQGYYGWYIFGVISIVSIYLFYYIKKYSIKNKCPKCNSGENLHLKLNSHMYRCKKCTYIFYKD